MRVDLRRATGAAALAGGVLLFIRVGLVLLGGDPGLVRIATTAGTLLLALASGLIGWNLAESRSTMVRAGAAAVGVMVGGVVVLVLSTLVSQLVAGGPAALAELGTLAVALLAVVFGAATIGRRPRAYT
jgi:hypothetical protein